MNQLVDIRSFSKIHLTHGLMITDGMIERLFMPDRLEIVLKSSGLFNEPDLRFPVTTRMLFNIKLLADGNYQMDF